MEQLDKFTKFILLEEYYYDNIGGNLDIIFQCINELESFINPSSSYDIFKSGLDKFKKIDKINDINNLKRFINSIFEVPYGYIPIIIPKHLIGTFFYKNSDNTYDFSIINTGDGIIYQRIFNKNFDNKKINFTNGIIIFKNVNIDNIKNFITYMYFLIINNTFNQNNDSIFKTQHILEIFYKGVYEHLLDFNNINFNDFNLSSDKYILIETPSQIIGDCSLKSFIYTYILLDYYNIIKYKKIKQESNKHVDDCLRNYWKTYLIYLFSK
jgi:hypothetical protein